MDAVACFLLLSKVIPYYPSSHNKNTSYLKALFTGFKCVCYSTTGQKCHCCHHLQKLIQLLQIVTFHQGSNQSL